MPAKPWEPGIESHWVREAPLLPEKVRSQLEALLDEVEREELAADVCTHKVKF